jgi:hypothetical protein
MSLNQSEGFCDVANSGYMPDMKVEKNQEPILGYLLELIVGDFNFFFSKFGEFEPFFSSNFFLYWSKSHFPGRIFVKIHKNSPISQ